MALNKITPDEIKNSTEKILVKFTTTWCGPCKTLTPILEEISKEIDFKIFELNAEEFPTYAKEAGIRAVPVSIVYENGKEIDRKNGLVVKSKLLDWLNTFNSTDSLLNTSDF